jgi:hypothetical protein
MFRNGQRGATIIYLYPSYGREWYESVEASG